MPPLSAPALALLRRHSGGAIGPIEVFPSLEVRPDWPVTLVVFGAAPNGDLWAVDTSAGAECVVVVDGTADSLDDEGSVFRVCGSVAELLALAAADRLPATHFDAANSGGPDHPLQLDPEEGRVIQDVLSVLRGQRDALPPGSARKVEAVLASLPAQQQAVLRLRLGTGDSEPFTPRQVARALGLDRDMARGLELEATAALRALGAGRATGAGVERGPRR